MTPEQSLTHQVMTWLAIKNILHYRVRNTGTIIHYAGGVKFGRDRYFRQQAGCPDILAWNKGNAYAFELKSPTGRLRPEQSAWLNRFQSEGGRSYVVRKLEDVAAALEIPV